MIVSPQVVAKAKEQGELGPPGNRLRPEVVVDWLAQRTSPNAQKGARELLQKMASSWRVITDIHKSEDQTAHITIEVAGKRYHLRLDARRYIFDITTVTGSGAERQTERPAGKLPWVRPGTSASGQ